MVVEWLWSCVFTHGMLPGVDSFKDGRGHVAKRSMFWNNWAIGCRQFQGLEGSCCQTHHVLEYSGGWVSTVSRIGGVMFPSALSFRTFWRLGADSFKVRRGRDAKRSMFWNR